MIKNFFLKKSDSIVLICFEFMYCIVDVSPNTELLDYVHQYFKPNIVL